jgi:hypothetical protein
VLHNICAKQVLNYDFFSGKKIAPATNVLLDIFGKRVDDYL